MGEGRGSPWSIPCVLHLLGEFDHREVGAGIRNCLLEEGLFTLISENIRTWMEWKGRRVPMCAEAPASVLTPQKGPATLPPMPLSPSLCPRIQSKQRACCSRRLQFITTLSPRSIWGLVLGYGAAQPMSGKAGQELGEGRYRLSLVAASGESVAMTPLSARELVAWPALGHLLQLLGRHWKGRLRCGSR